MARILLIEDEAAIRRVLVKILTEESEHYEVEEAADGLEGIEKIKDHFNDKVVEHSAVVNLFHELRKVNQENIITK